MNDFHSLRKLLLVILPLMAALLLFGLALGSGIAEGPTKTSFIVYIFLFSALLMIEFVLLLKKKWLKLVSIISIATVLYLFGEYFEIFHLLDYIEKHYFN
jgi:DMSO/TMAO reductase YedYZ heme-binding membrane subunit